MWRKEWQEEIAYAEQVEEIACALSTEIINVLEHLKEGLKKHSIPVRGPVEEREQEHKWTLYVNEEAEEDKRWQIVFCLRTSRAREGTLKGVDLALTFEHDTGQLFGELVPSREDKICPGKLVSYLENDDWTFDQNELRKRLTTIVRLTGASTRKEKNND